MSLSSLATAALSYDLPRDAIATEPSARREDARLMVLRASDPAATAHLRISDLPEVLRSGDLLVRNTTRVLPAHLSGARTDSGGRVHGLYLGSIAGCPPSRAWRVLLTSNGRLRPGAEVELSSRNGRPSGWRLRLEHKDGEGAWSAAVTSPDGLFAQPDEAVLSEVGRPPLPPYIVGARRQAGAESHTPSDDARYQTVYAQQAGSVAAPTAGLHFTPALFAALSAQGIRTAETLLHVGAGTFKPVEAENLAAHRMHAERYEVDPSVFDRVTACRVAGGRSIAIGTTTARALESVHDPQDFSQLSGQTRLLIAPGHAWRWFDGLLTNFHLPRSTLLALVSSLLPEGASRLLVHYREALDAGYRFYSYGDAMLVLP